MIAVWDGKITPKTETSHPSAFWDVFPTVAEITGIETPGNIDGISFLPTLLGQQENQKQHEYLYWEFHEQGGKKPCGKATGSWLTTMFSLLKKPQWNYTI
jgi:arylsulfatase A